VTSAPECQWNEWRKECGGGLFTMKSFTEKEAIALRLVILASIQFILSDLFSQHNIKP